MTYTGTPAYPHTTSEGGEAIGIVLINASGITATSTGEPIMNYRERALIFTGTVTSNQGVFTVDVSPDNSNWHTVDLLYDSNGEDAPVASVTISSTGAKMAIVPYPANYLRVKVTVTATGTYSAIFVGRS